MFKTLLLIFTFIGVLNLNSSQAQLFSDDFGTFYSSSGVSTIKWPTATRGGTASSYNSSGSACYSSGDYTAYLSGYGSYYTTQGILIPSGGATLDFEYNFNYGFSFPEVQVATSSTGPYTPIKTLSNTGTSCSTESVNLSYSNQTIYIRFRSNTSSKIFYFDDVAVTASSGGGGSCAFSEDFGSSFVVTFPGTNWQCKSGSASAYPSSLGDCDGSGYGAYLSQYNYYITVGINIPSTGYTLDFDYKISYFSGSGPQVYAATTSSCFASFTSLKTLTSTSGVCQSESINLDAYSGQTIYLRFYNWNSSSFYFDNIQVCDGGGSSGGSCDLFSHSGTSTSGLNTSGISTNAGTTLACTGGDYVLYTSSSSPFIATDDIAVPQGKGASLEFTAKKYSGYSGTGEIWIHVGGYCSFQKYTSPYYYDNGWVQIGTFNPTTSCSTFGPFTVPGDVIGGQNVSFCIVPRNASSTFWVSVDDICVSEFAGSSVPTTLDEDFGTSSSGWYPQSGYVDIPYHTRKSASDAYVYLFSGVDGGLDKAAYFYTGFDYCSTVSGVGIVTREINTSGYSNGQISLSFKSQYPCGGADSYTFDEDYTTYSPEVYIMEGPDHGSNSWVQIPVNYYFPDYEWQRATFDISDYKNANVRIKIERGGFCSTQLEAVDNIKISDRNCAISKLTTGVISGPNSIAPNTNYNYSVAAVSGASYYKWYVRNDGILYDASPYIVSGQGTNNATINFGSLSSPLRVLCLPFDSDPASNEDACYAKISYLTTTACATFIWAGATDTLWFEASNWDCGNIPTATSNVTIPDVSGASGNFPVIEGLATAYANNLTIDAGAILTISKLNNGELEIYGNLANSGQVYGKGSLTFKGTSQTLTGGLSFNGIINVNSGTTLNTNNVLTLESDASLMHGTGTTKGGGSVNGTVKVKRTGSSNAAVYNYWSSPIENANVSLLGGTRYYYEPANATDTTETGLRKGWVVANSTMNPGVGYIATGSGTVIFDGTVNDAPAGSEIIVSVRKNVGVTNEVGFNLVGNPFPCALDAAAFLAANPGIDGSVSMWDDDGTGGSGWNAQQDYATWNGVGTAGTINSSTVFNGHIASGQSFFILKPTDGSTQVSFDNSMRSTLNDRFFRQAPIQRLWVSVLNPNNIYNETLIGFLPDATEGKDRMYDAIKIKGNPNVSIYTKLNARDLAIQGYPLLSADRIVPLGLDVAATGNHILRLKQMENLDESVTVILEDKKLGAFQNLNQNDTYMFNQSAGKDIDRFRLHINPAIELTTIEAGCEGINNGMLLMDHPGNKKWNILLTDDHGDSVTSKQNFTGSAVISHLKAGVYNLILVDEYGYHINKIVEVDSLTPVTADFLMPEKVGILTPVAFQNVSEGADQYEWDLGDGAMVWDENPTHIYSVPGIYQVKLNASNVDCNNEIIRVLEVEDLKTGLNATSNLPQVTINAVENNIRLTFKNINADAGIILYNILGQQILQKRMKGTGVQQIQVENIAEGFYLVRVTVHDLTFTRKIFLSK